MKKLKLKNNFRIKGKYRFRTFKAGTKELIRETDWISNLIVMNATTGGHGLYLVLNRLLGVQTYDLEITQAKIGDGITAPAITDTDLVNAIVSGIAIARKQRIADDEILFSFFINDSELPNGDYKEFGIFCSLQMFARSLISPTYTKSAGEDSQVDYSLSAESTI